MRSIVCFVLLAFLFSATSLSGCTCRPKCLPEPETDTTPPTAGALIAYYVDGNEETKTVGAQDPEVTIQVDADSDFEVIYSGQDNEGMRNLNLYAQGYWYPSTGVIQQGHFGIDPITTSCPRNLLMGAMTFHASQTPGKIVLTISSENWMGLTTSTNAIILRFGTPPQPLEIP